MRINGTWQLSNQSFGWLKKISIAKGLSSIHTELLVIVLALVMQKWVENVANEWVEYPFLAMSSNANSITNAQCEWTLTVENLNFAQKLKRNHCVSNSISAYNYTEKFIEMFHENWHS